MKKFFTVAALVLALIIGQAAQAHLIHRYVGGRDFLHGKPIRYCLWLFNMPTENYLAIPHVATF